MSMYHPRLQSFGALLVLDADCRRIQASSTNLTRLTGIERPENGPHTLAYVLGKRLSQRVRRELQGQQKLSSPLVFIRSKHSNMRFQLYDAFSRRNPPGRAARLLG